MKRTGQRLNAVSTAARSCPVTTTISVAPPLASALTTRSISVRPSTRASSLLSAPKRREAPAASTTAAMLPSAGTARHFDDLGQDRHGDLRGTLGADGETDGRVDALQLVRSETGRRQSLQTLGMRAARAQRADVKTRRAQGCRQRLVVDVRSVGEGDDRRARIEPELVERSFWPFRHGRAGAEALLAGKHRARVDDYDRITDLTRQLGKHLPDVRRAGSDDA